MAKIDFDTVKNDSSGRWFGIYKSLGIDVGDNPNKHTKCPLCGKDSFRCDDKNGMGDWICTCGAGDGWALLQQVLGCDFKGAIEQVAPLLGSVSKTDRPEEKPADPTILREMFTSSKPATESDLVGKYLKKRGVKVLPSCLRLHLGCWDGETRRNHPAMLAVVTANSGKAITIHRTYLSHEATKADMDKPKKLMPCLAPAAGAAIRLFDIEGTTLGIAEGIETAIAANEMFNVPVWAVISTSGVKSFNPPPEVKKLIIFGDNDANYAGQAAAYQLANRMVLHNKIECFVELPKKIGDWLDVLNSK